MDFAIGKEARRKKQEARGKGQGARGKKQEGTTLSGRHSGISPTLLRAQLLFVFEIMINHDKSVLFLLSVLFIFVCQSKLSCRCPCVDSL